jgi:hypothetical protein
VIKKNINDKIYWKNLDDGNYIYSIQLDEGFYSIDLLISSMEMKMNTTIRNINTTINKCYNNFKINIDKYSHKILFKSFYIDTFPNSLDINVKNINGENYYLLVLYNTNVILNTNDTVIISNSTNVTFKNSENEFLSIDSKYINKSHSIYSSDNKNYIYEIILGKISAVKTYKIDFNLKGGEDIVIEFNNKFCLLFNYHDTIGEILGFKNLGNFTSITDYKTEITNQDEYIDYNNLNTVGNKINYNNGFINLTGKFNYLLLFLNNIEYIYNDILPACFSKILLSGSPGEILFNTHVIQPKNIYSNSFPINTLSELKIHFLYPDGSKVNFRNINHSFTLNITQEIDE